jgi:bacillithiol system protein YtxJ
VNDQRPSTKGKRALTIRALTGGDAESFASLRGHGPVVIYKHSPYCGVSIAALRQVEAFAGTHPDIDIVQVDVIRQRSFSQYIAGALGITHASPQAILVVGGRVTWSATHHAVTEPAISAAVRSAGAFASAAALTVPRGTSAEP